MDSEQIRLGYLIDACEVPQFIQGTFDTDVYIRGGNVHVVGDVYIQGDLYLASGTLEDFSGSYTITVEGSLYVGQECRADGTPLVYVVDELYQLANMQRRALEFLVRV